MMPWMNRLGVSHKIEDEEERKRLRDLFENIKLPQGMGLLFARRGRGFKKRCAKRSCVSEPFVERH